MKTEFTAGGVLALTAVAGVAIFLYWNRDAIKGAVQAVNPASDQNLAYRAANAITQTVTGQPNISFGSWLYDVTHPNQYDPTAPTPLTPRGPSAWDSILARRAREAPGAPGLNMTAAEENYVQGGLFGFMDESVGPDGRKELTFPATPTTWVVVAGISALMLAANHAPKRRRRSRR